MALGRPPVVLDPALVGGRAAPSRSGPSTRRRSPTGAPRAATARSWCRAWPTRVPSASGDGRDLHAPGAQRACTSRTAARCGRATWSTRSCARARSGRWAGACSPAWRGHRATTTAHGRGWCCAAPTPRSRTRWPRCRRGWCRPAPRCGRPAPGRPRASARTASTRRDPGARFVLIAQPRLQPAERSGRPARPRWSVDRRAAARPSRPTRVAADTARRDDHPAAGRPSARSSGRSSATATTSIPTSTRCTSPSAAAAPRSASHEAARGARARARQARGGAPPRGPRAHHLQRAAAAAAGLQRDRPVSRGATAASTPTSSGRASSWRRPARWAGRWPCGPRAAAAPVARLYVATLRKIGLLATREPRARSRRAAARPLAPPVAGPGALPGPAGRPGAARGGLRGRGSTADELASVNDPDERARLARALDARAGGERRTRALRELAEDAVSCSERIDVANCASFHPVFGVDLADLCLR